MRRGFIKFLSVPVKLTRINVSDISQIGGANGYADDRDQAIPSSNPNGRTYFLFLFLMK